MYSYDMLKTNFTHYFVLYPPFLIWVQVLTKVVKAANLKCEDNNNTCCLMMPQSSIMTLHTSHVNLRTS